MNLPEKVFIAEIKKREKLTRLIVSDNTQDLIERVSEYLNRDESMTVCDIVVELELKSATVLKRHKYSDLLL